MHWPEELDDECEAVEGDTGYEPEFDFMDHLASSPSERDAAAPISAFHEATRDRLRSFARNLTPALAAYCVSTAPPPESVPCGQSGCKSLTTLHCRTCKVRGDAPTFCTEHGPLRASDHAGHAVYDRDGFIVPGSCCPHIIVVYGINKCSFS